MFEQAIMTAEDRKWHIKRIQEEIRKQEEANKKVSHGPPGVNLT